MFSYRQGMHYANNWFGCSATSVIWMSQYVNKYIFQYSITYFDLHTLVDFNRRDWKKKCTNTYNYKRYWIITPYHETDQLSPEIILEKNNLKFKVMGFLCASQARTWVSKCHMLLSFYCPTSWGESYLFVFLIWVEWLTSAVKTFFS